jgi:hypothetical protein
MSPGFDSASKNEYQGFLLGVKAAGAWGWRPTTLVVPNVKEIRGPNLPGTPLGPCGLLWVWPDHLFCASRHYWWLCCPHQGIYIGVRFTKQFFKNINRNCSNWSVNFLTLKKSMFKEVSNTTTEINKFPRGTTSGNESNPYWGAAQHVLTLL